MRGRKAMKRILLRTLKEIGRLALILIVPLLLPFISAEICIDNRNSCPSDCQLSCFQGSRIVYLSNLVIIVAILFVFIRRKKLSRLWLIECIALHLILNITAQVLDYVAESKSQNMVLEDERQHSIVERDLVIK